VADSKALQELTPGFLMLSIMAQTGHRSLATLHKSIREGSLFLENAAALLGL